MRNLDIISNELAEVEKQIKEEIVYNETIEVELMNISRKIAELQIEKKDKQIVLTKGKNLLKRFNIEHGALKREYFNYNKTSI